MKERKKVVNRTIRTNPIDKHYTDCLECGHIHDVEALMRYYKRQGGHSIHYLCDICHHRMRLTITKFNFLVFHKQAVNGYEKKQWEDVFKTARIEIPEDVKDWLTRSYQPPRARASN